MNRTEMYKRIAFENGNRFPWYPEECQYLMYKRIAEAEFAQIHNLKRADIECSILDHYSIEINSLELLAGRFSNGFVLTDEQRNIMEKGRGIYEAAGISGGWRNNATGHRVIDYKKLLRVGIKGILAEIDANLEKIDYNSPEAVEKKAFYAASKKSLEAVCRFAKRYYTELIQAAENETESERRQELKRMAENFTHAPFEPCAHFYEALQCMWFVQFCLKLVDDISLTGRMDNYLFPYYKKDIEEGYITEEFAFELIEQLYFKHNEIYCSWPAAIMLGGVDRQGRPVWNTLTYLCVKAIETTGLVNPSVAVCYTEDMPEDLLELCVDMISKGYTRPSIFNDRVIQEGLLEAGVSVEDARYYVHSTCVEITPIACSNIRVATPYININQAFEKVLHRADLNTFEKFSECAKNVAAEIIRKDLTRVCEDMYAQQQYASSPLASAFINDCLERGKDCGAGGARYDFIYPCFPGFVNFVDILAAVKKAVYEEQVLTLSDVAEMCENNFEGNEKWRQYLLNICPKFGNDEDEVDALAKEIYEFIRSELKKYQTSLGGTFHPSYFAWIMHGALGKQTQATPDGRKEGEALSENMGAMQGRDKNGPLAVMRSIEKIDQKYGIGGIATNFRFAKSFIGSDKGKLAVKNFIKVFMDNDCFEIQFNVVDQQDLMEAKKAPEKYRTLLVRVAGYSDYFVNLDPVIQGEIIKRSEHNMI